MISQQFLIDFLILIFTPNKKNIVFDSWRNCHFVQSDNPTSLNIRPKNVSVVSIFNRCHAIYFKFRSQQISQTHTTMAKSHWNVTVLLFVQKKTRSYTKLDFVNRFRCVIWEKYSWNCLQEARHRAFGNFFKLLSTSWSPEVQYLI